MENKKRNWFNIEGIIRTDKEMTVEELAVLLDKLGFEFVGNVKPSDITDAEVDKDFREGLKELTDKYDNTLKNLANQKKKYTLEELTKDCKPENRHEEVDWGKPEGKEIW